MNINTRKKLAQFFEEILPKKVPIMWMDQDAPRPETLYVTLKITPIELTDRDSYENQPDGSIKQTTRKSFDLSVQTYRMGALDLIEEIRKSLRKKSYVDEFYRFMGEDNACFSIGDVNNIVDLTGLVETNFEERAQFIIKINASESFIDNGFKDCGLGAKFPVNIKGSIKKENGTDAIIKEIAMSK